MFHTYFVRIAAHNYFYLLLCVSLMIIRRFNYILKHHVNVQYLYQHYCLLGILYYFVYLRCNLLIEHIRAYNIVKLIVS